MLAGSNGSMKAEVSLQKELEFVFGHVLFSHCIKVSTFAVDSLFTDFKMNRQETLSQKSSNI